MAQVGEDKGPKDWDLLELQVNGAIDVGSVNTPDLDGTKLPLLEIFKPGRWQVKPEELELLKPSIQLASNLVRVGLPYIATFLPTRDDIFIDDNFYNEDGDRANLCPSSIPLKKNPSKNEVAAALDALEKLAPSVRWQTNYEMWSSWKWIGVTRLVEEARPWSEIQPEQIEDEDEESMKNELDHRPLIIGIMGEYVAAIKKAPKDSEQHLRAVFMAGITMAHEVGHAIFHQEFRSYNPPDLSEPYIGDGCERELGTAFIAWIFGGFHPNGSELPPHSFADFTAHLSWVQHYTTSMNARPLYKSLYSIPMQYIKERLTQEWWNNLPGTPELLVFSEQAKKGLKPNTDPDSNTTATARVPEWAYDRFKSEKASWKYDFDFKIPGYGRRDKVAGLSIEELEWQKARQPTSKWDAVLDAKTPAELKELQRTFQSLKSKDYDDEDEDEDFLPRQRKQVADIDDLDIEDGIIEKDVIPPPEDDTTPLTRIVVRFLPDAETSVKRSRDEDEDEDDDDDDGDNHHHGRSAKRAKQEGNSHAGNGHMKTELDKFLAKTSPFTIASDMTRLQIYNMLIQRKITPESRVEDSQGWQQGHPDPEDTTDMWDVHRLYIDVLTMAELDLFAGDTEAARQARIALRRASLASVQDWSWKHIIDHCHLYQVPVNGGIDQVRRRLRNWMRSEIETLRHEGRSESPPSDEDRAAEATMKEKAASNPENWSLDNLQTFCRQNDLSPIGTLTSLIVKVKLFLREKSLGRRILRRPQRARTDLNGFEVYTFKAILGQSTVAALKSELFITGKFPPETILTLYFRTDYSAPLQDDQPLSDYVMGDWETLRLKIARNDNHSPGSTRGNPIEIDAKPVVHFHDPLPLPGSTIATAIEIPDLPVVTLDDEPSPAEILKAVKDDPAVQREAAIKITGANPTLSELLTAVGDRAAALDRFVQAGGKFGDPRNPQPATDGVGIMEEIEDYEDEEEDRMAFLKGLMGEAELREKMKAEDRYPPGGTSHMADLFHEANKPVVPKNEEDDSDSDLDGLPKAS